MSRIGRQPISVPAGVTVAIEPERVTVNGPRGELSERIPRDIQVEQTDGQILVTRPTDRGEHRALHGLTRTLIANMVQGVTDGFEKRLEIQGVGYRAQLRGRDLELALGYSHPVAIKAPDGIEFEVPVPTRIIVKGASKQQVGEIAATIRKQRKPEPYKGKGIRYEGEYVARKVGKRA
jgi:large subunit ribosomal protein L6